MPGSFSSYRIHRVSRTALHFADICKQAQYYKNRATLDKEPATMASYKATYHERAAIINAMGGRLQ